MSEHGMTDSWKLDCIMESLVRIETRLAKLKAKSKRQNKRHEPSTGPTLLAAAGALREILCYEPMPATDLFAIMAEKGFSKATTKRAKKLVGINSKCKGFGAGSTWYWQI